MSLMEPSEGLFGTPVELEVIERGLRRGLKTTKKCGGDKNIIRIGENQGFFSRVGVLRCNWPEGTTSLPTEVVVKITTLLNTIAMHNRNGGKKAIVGDAAKRDKLLWQAKGEKLRKWHNNEIFFYETVKSLKVGHSFLPEVYHGRKFDEENAHVGFICMEFAKDAKCAHVYHNLSVVQITEVLSAIAQLQSTMNYLPTEIKKQFTVNPYEELYADILQTAVLSFRLDELRTLDNSLSHLIDKVDSEIGRIINLKVAKRDHLDLGMNPIFVQGDLYSPNLLWDLNENEEMQLNKIVDWQLCHFGSAAEDIARLFISSMKTEDRRNEWERLIEEYHRELHLHLDEQLFTVEQLKTSYRHFFPTAALAFLGTVHEVFTAAIHNCPKEKVEKWKSTLVEKVRGILEDVLHFANRKQG